MGCAQSKPSTSSSNKYQQSDKEINSNNPQKSSVERAPTDTKSTSAENGKSVSSPNSSGIEKNSVAMSAINKIQRQARRKKAMQYAKAEQQWKMFADLDTQDEAEMLHLAVFMQTLIDFVPGTDKFDSKKIARVLSTPGDETPVDDERDEEDNEDDLQMVKLESIRFEDTPQLPKRAVSFNGEYEITESKIDGNVCNDIVATFRRQGKISRKSVVKVLRKSYKMLQKEKNMTRMTVENNCKLTVVGDLHGQLADLLHILDEVGMPSPTNKFVFNGDFVDRGNESLEIITILFAFYVCWGSDVVALNRGNHEDLPVCRVYGFEGEIKSKFDELLFEMFAEVFTFIPLFTLVNNSVFVVHGGLFHTPLIKLDELEEIQRSDYHVKPPISYPQNTVGKSAAEARQEFMRQLQRDALWSDPTEQKGCYLNPRGAGVSFGPDVAQEFMNRNNISMVIRSHECVFRGFDLPFAASHLRNNIDSEDYNIRGMAGHEFENPEGFPLLCTVFSASNYCDGDNEGAFIKFLTHPSPNCYPAGGQSNLYYSIQHFKLTAGESSRIAKSNQSSLIELILKKKTALLNAFEAADTENIGMVSRIDWADIMQRVTMVRIRWLGIITTVASESCLTPTSVNYREFLSSFTVQKLKQQSADTNATNGSPEKTDGMAKSMDEMYGQRKKLETVFFYFDANNDGMISREEFRDGCAALNARLHPDCQLTDIDHTLNMMDFDQSGSIDINEFFETFRILDAKDGNVDGVISLADTSTKAPLRRTISEKAKQMLN
eukprot:gene13918-18665_t